MEANYIIILDFSVGEVIKIKLSEKEKQESENYENYEDFLITLEEKYDFRLKDCIWMTTETYSERSYNV
ncbi:hypothetical protein DXA95_15865 [Odoribacter sp. OF09-27XD]|jgi:hypothetical protein|nr:MULTISPECIES: hypothetical protein [Odoribacteraceae]RHV89625.1 hypothetical protein DXA95_15865 [Odoribacter sp. OF09-27XD]